MNFLFAAGAVVTAILPAPQDPPPPLLDVVRVEHAWPAAMTGPSSDVAVGAFVGGHPGRSAVTVRNGSLVLSFQPAVVEQFVPVGWSGIAAIATIPGMDGRRDRLAAVSAAGLHVLKLGEAGFVNANAGPLASWADSIDVKCAVFGSGAAATTLFLGIAPNAVRVAMLGASDAAVPIVAVPLPAPGQVLDAVLMDWWVGGLPEIVALTTSGLFVLNLAGTVEESMPGTTDAGKLAVLHGMPVPSVLQVTRQGSQWRVDTVSSGNVLAGGFLTLARPLVGLALTELNGDSYADAVVSTGESVRHVLLGSAQGPQAESSGRVDIADVAPTTPLSPLVDNLANLVVDDIDLDGRHDFVIAQQAANELVVIPAVQSQLVAHFQPGLPVVVDAATGLALEAPVGWLVDGSPLPFHTSAFWGDKDALVLRLRLPEGWSTTWSAAQRILVTVYPIVADGSPDGDDSFEPADGESWIYELSNSSSATLADLAVPFADALDSDGTTDPLWPGHERFVLELVLVTLNGNGGFTSAGEPLFLSFGLRPDMNQELEDLLGTLGNDDDDAQWWMEELTTVSWASVPPPAQSGIHPDTEPTGNRWVGANRTLRHKKAQNQVPVAPVPTPMGAAQLH